MSRLARGPSFWGTGAVLVGLRMVVISSFRFVELSYKIKTQQFLLLP